MNEIQELREVAALLEAATQVADGLVDLLNYAYKHDQRMSDALAAANDAAVRVRTQHMLAEDRCRS